MPLSPRSALRLTVSCALAALALLSSTGPASAAAPHATAALARDAVDAARAEYADAGAKVAALSAQADRLTVRAEAAEAEAERLRDSVSDDDGGGVLSAFGDLVGIGSSDLDRAAEAAVDARDARALAGLVEAALADQIAATEQARVAWHRAERRQERVEAQWSARQAAQAAIERAQFRPAYDVADRAQDRRNRRALSAWHDYLRELADAGVVPPPAADLADPARLPAGLEPMYDARNEASPGVAVLDRRGRAAITVLSAETVRAVSETFGRIGLPEVPGAVEPAAYACGGLVANAWASATAALPSDAIGQWRSLRAVPARSAQTGDVVALGSRRTGLVASGVHLGGGQVAVVDAATGVAAVRPLAMPVLGARRVGPAAGAPEPDPAGGTCGGDDSVVAASGPLVLPMATGSYALSAGFGDAGARWSSGTHTGQDFSAPIGTPVVAAAAGTVTVEHPSWAGSLVRIDHGGGVETWYAHLSRVDVVTGDRIAAGAAVGAVGDRGNSTGPHLHFEVRLDGTAHDPAQVLALPGGQAPSYANGELPTTALCPATPDGGQRLRCDAAVAYRMLGAGFADAFGTELCGTDSYRSRDGQERVFTAKPGLAAVPGTSVHGLGLAVDLCGGVERFGSAEHEWVVEHGPSYGWRHPDWAAAGGSRPEPWHFEYAGTR